MAGTSRSNARVALWKRVVGTSRTLLIAPTTALVRRSRVGSVRSGDGESSRDPKSPRSAAWRRRCGTPTRPLPASSDSHVTLVWAIASRMEPCEPMRRPRLKRIHVNQHVIRKNQKTDSREPPLRVKMGKVNLPAHAVSIHGPSSLIYRPDDPLSCGARVWIETSAPLLLLVDGAETAIE